MAEYNCIKSVQQYINRILKPRDAQHAISGMKCMLMDKDTKTMVSMVTNMSAIGKQEVFSVDNLESAAPESLGHMKVIIIARPSRDSLARIEEHLKAPKFVEYHLFFTNFLSADNMKRLADADKLGVVKQVQEFYIDYQAINADLFSLGLKGSLALCRPRGTWAPAESANLSRCHQGLLALLLSFKVKPAIRYLASSDAAAQLARDVNTAISTESQLFTFNKGSAGSPLLLILDRKEDPVTPLLSQWTYQAMVHELLPGGISHNRVDLRGAAGVSKDLEEVVLSPSDDEFFREHMYTKYWELTPAVGALSTAYSREKDRVQAGMAGPGVEGLSAGMMALQDLGRKGLIVSKHLALGGELEKAHSAATLIEQGEVEQALAGGVDAPSEHLASVVDWITRPGQTVAQQEVLRLVMLYALRYERSAPGKVAELLALAAQRHGIEAGLVNDLLTYAGAAARSTGGLFGSLAGGGMRTFFKGFLGVGAAEGGDSSLMQHSPLLVGLLDKLARGEGAGGAGGASGAGSSASGGKGAGDMSRATFPFLGQEPSPPGKYSVVIVFIVGGATYEEAYKVAEINAGRLGLGGKGGSSSAPSTPPFKVILGGSSMLSTKTFMAELIRMGSTGITVMGGGGSSGVGF